MKHPRPRGSKAVKFEFCKVVPHGKLPDSSPEKLPEYAVHTLAHSLGLAEPREDHTTKAVSFPLKKNKTKIYLRLDLKG